MIPGQRAFCIVTDNKKRALRWRALFLFHNGIIVLRAGLVDEVNINGAARASENEGLSLVAEYATNSFLPCPA